MFDKDVYLRDMKIVERLRSRTPEDKLKEIDEAVENRLERHLLQKPVPAKLDKDVVGGRNLFGVIMRPRNMDEPYRCEANYVIMTTVSGDGKPLALYVVVRVWDDWSCKLAIDYNKAMVARVLADRKMSFTSRMQTEVQTLCVLMWMQLRGRFFWNENKQSFQTSLYFDGAKRMLYSIQSDAFQAWLLAHTGITNDKADFKRLMATINSAAMNPEVSHGIVPGALFDRRGDVVYISSGDSEMVKVEPSADGSKITVVPNGTDNVVFTQGMTLAPWEIVEGPGVDPFDAEHGVAPFSTANYQSEHGRMIARMWFLSMPSCLRCYPAIVFTGKMRSGKSRTASGIFELLGMEPRLASILKNGDKDFWVVINKGGVVCFDNVDTKNEWFGDAMQLACTGGSHETRTLFENEGTTTLRSNARIILTSNNPMFASESGLADRLQIVRLGQFDGRNGKEVGDSSITRDVAANRNAVITWLARTVSKALADREPVASNVNMRHPDFADFAMRASRALNLYEDSVLALKSAEFDKAMLTIQSNTKINYVYEAMVAHFTDPVTKNDPWVGKSSEMKAEIVKLHPDLEGSKYLTDTGLGMAMTRYLDNLQTVFDLKIEKGAQTKYVFNGFSDAYAKNVQPDAGDEINDKKEGDADENAPW